MIAILKQSASDEAVGHIVSWIEKKGLKTDVSRGENETIIGLVGDTTKIDPFLLESMDVVERVQRVSEPLSAPTASSTPRTPSSTAATASRSAATSSRSSPVPALSRAKTSFASHDA